mmetsp:Transcript_14756/g.20519  ORF Transcript_14756/g.20519 Transcript_14756/m.20519 type:complete len:297 (-) Transcript_14756:205-1095(-)
MLGVSEVSSWKSATIRPLSALALVAVLSLAANILGTEKNINRNNLFNGRHLRSERGYLGHPLEEKRCLMITDKIEQCSHATTNFPVRCWVKAGSKLDVFHPERFNEVFISSDQLSSLDSILDSSFQVLRPGGQIIIQLNKGLKFPKSSLNLAGFIHVRVNATETSHWIIGTKPMWNANSFKRLVTKNSWEAQPEESAVMIDPESLIDVSPKSCTDTVSPPIRRRACENCVCGRKEKEIRGEVVDQEIFDQNGVLLPPKTGGCGNCARGDSFRCDGCPYRGQPAFRVVDNMVKLENE